MVLKDALQMMEESDGITGDRQTFDVEFITCNREKKTGGEIIRLKGVRKVGSRFHQKKLQMINVQAPGSSYHPFPIHIRLILRVNNEKIYW